ncbi:MAG TPA: class E sortase [Microbacteriaceae bacterium]|nr:class E sortase [Microbacteriaceae bacterium]
MTAPLRPRQSGFSVIGALGELLLTAGVVVLLFLAWQLWWNDAILAQSQSSAAADVSSEWMAAATPTPGTASETPTPAGPGPVDYGQPITLESVPAEGTAFGIMYVPRFGQNTQRQIAQGVGTDVLNSTRLGVGHYMDSALPGEPGNFAIAAHRSAYGGGMHLINELQVGDPIYIQTKDGWYTYRFRNFEYVRASAVAVVSAVPQNRGTDTGQRLITLTTCNPLYSTSERIVAYGVFDTWQPNSAGPPAEIAADVAGWKK